MSRDEEFRAYVTSARPSLLRAATLLAAGDAHLAEDVVQTSLTKLYVAWPRVRREGPDRYVRRILVNAFTDETRRPSWRRERSSAELPDVAAADPRSPEDKDAVRRALAALPPRMRAAVVLRYWLELDVAETASALGCGQGTVKSQTARGLDRLRELLGPLDEPAEPTPTPTRSMP
ncbi:MAG TPA: SigE family RNA polymerase sigma factor [Frankiaceae bacterium]|jgi:RNA polymerase sigma-70 factor (sigma-E family)|nr:SigE family RNA polymerase sigma factor [Frankiaceae bacterium]